MDAAQLCNAQAKTKDDLIIEFLNSFWQSKFDYSLDDNIQEYISFDDDYDDYELYLDEWQKKTLKNNRWTPSSKSLIFNTNVSNFDNECFEDYDENSEGLLTQEELGPDENGLKTFGGESYDLEKFSKEFKEHLNFFNDNIFKNKTKISEEWFDKEIQEIWTQTDLSPVSYVIDYLSNSAFIKRDSLKKIKKIYNYGMLLSYDKWKNELRQGRSK